MGLSTLFAFPVFGSTLLERFIKIIFILTGFLGIDGLIRYAVGLNLTIFMIGLMSWNIIMPIAASLMIFYFKNHVNTVNDN